MFAESEVVTALSTRAPPFRLEGTEEQFWFNIISSLGLEVEGEVREPDLSRSSLTGLPVDVAMSSTDIFPLTTFHHTLHTQHTL